MQCVVTVVIKIKLEFASKKVFGLNMAYGIFVLVAALLNMIFIISTKTGGKSFFDEVDLFTKDARINQAAQYFNLFSHVLLVVILMIIGSQPRNEVDKLEMSFDSFTEGKA